MRSRIPQFVLMAAVLCAAAYGFITNCMFAKTLGRENFLAQSLYILIAVVTGTIKTVLPVYLEDKTTPNRPGIWFLFFTALVLDICWGLGYASITRGAATAEASRALKDYKALEADVEREETARKALPAPSVSAAQLKAEADRLRAAAGGCKTQREQGAADCLKVASKEIEHSKALEYEKAKSREDEARDRLRKAPKPESVKGDGAATAVGEAARNLGWQITDETAGKLLSVLIMIACEGAAVWGFKTALRAPYLHLPAPLPVPQPAAPPVIVAAKPLPSVANPVLSALKSVASAPPPGLTRTATGGLYGTQRALAAALSLSASEMNRQLRALALSGLIVLGPGNKGTSIEFV